MCTAAFVSHVDPSMVLREEQLPSMQPIAWAIRYRVEPKMHEARATVLGAFGARAMYREGLGCTLIHGRDESVRDQRLVDAPIVSPFPDAVHAPDTDALRTALDLAFSEPDPAAPRHTKAVVILHDGKLVAERYADGYTPQTPIWAHSLTKSVMNAFAGILVQDGKLKVEQAAGVPEWSGANDSRHAITIDQLLRMTTGLPFDETDGPVSPMTRQFFLERDMRAYAAGMPLTHPPGSTWAYSNLAYVLLARSLMDAADVHDAPAAEQFLRDRLFRPLGMSHTLVEADEAGTLVGSSHTFGTARDFARFGQLYLDDGVIDGQRILPEGWVAYSHSQTLDTGYGAGFWTNLRQEGNVPVWDTPWGMPQLPRDTYFARGALGQYVMIVPSEKLVVVRMGISVNASTDIANVVARIIEAVHRDPATETSS
ncbi:class C beta-lactamase-related serine hydrolase [Dyella terrae]|uniref:Class C beta-lactamase-related serine hydrolase n=3 Tax=Rhodanobacteraceae TaxID=1775411 RepID=A0A4R0YDM3_9GAMM|nr:class C beta-lactamase-related serine hydrolase [Dyella terrae]TCI06015.1 class C beta-lactamase-related serine hydrolase [Dyella soli]